MPEAAVEFQVAAHEGASCSHSSGLVVRAVNERAAAIEAAFLHDSIDLDRHAIRRIRENVLTATGDHDHVSLLDAYRFGQTFDAYPAVSAGDQMEARDVAIGWHQNAPGCGKLGAEIQRAAHAQAIDNIVENIHVGHAAARAAAAAAAQQFRT